MKKLVRDNIPEIIKNKGEKPDCYVAGESEYNKELFRKLLEEANEVFDEQGDDEKLKGELGDLLEVIYSILDLKNISFEEIEKIRKIKKNKNGGFEKKYILNL